MPIQMRAVALRFLALLGVVILASCAKGVYAPQDLIDRYSYRHDGPPSLTLISVIRNKSQKGGHSALMINARERIIYDPAGRWHNPVVPERNDVLFGVNDPVLEAYNGFHARVTYHVVLQEIEVSAEIAQMAYDAALRQGASMDAMCAANVSAVLAQVPGFEDVGRSFFPHVLMKRFARLPGVETLTIYEDDVGKN